MCAAEEGAGVGSPVTAAVARAHAAAGQTVLVGERPPRSPLSTALAQGRPKPLPAARSCRRAGSRQEGPQLSSWQTALCRQHRKST